MRLPATMQRDAIIAAVRADMARDALLPGGGIVGRALSDFHGDAGSQGGGREGKHYSGETVPAK